MTNVQIDVKSRSDQSKVGVLTLTHAALNRIRTGHTLKVYSHRRIDEEVVLYCTGNPGGYVQHATLTNGNFQTGDILVIEEIRQ